MTDLRLDTTTHDLTITNGDIALVETATGESIGQRIKQALLFFLGEWYLDVLGGIPYFEVVFIKNPSQSILEAMFKESILTVPGVQEFTKFSLDYDINKRKLDFDFAVIIESGETIEFIEALSVL